MYTQTQCFRSCPGTAGAAALIENTPHSSNGIDVVEKLNIASGKFALAYWAVVIALMVILRYVMGIKHTWIIGLVAGVAYQPIGKMVQNQIYQRIINK